MSANPYPKQFFTSRATGEDYRRLILIPLLFILLIAVSIGYMWQGLHVHQLEVDSLEYLLQHRLLRLQYERDVLLAHQGIPTPHEAEIQKLEQVYENLLQGGEVTLFDLDKHNRVVTVTIPPPPTPEIHRLLLAKRAIVRQLQQEGEHLISLPQGSNAEKESLARFRALNVKLDTPGLTLANEYLDASNQQIYSMSGGMTTFLILMGGLGVLLAIRQRKTMEALQQSEAQYRSLVETATDGILVCDHNGRILSANPEAGAIFGYSTEEMNNLPLARLVHVQSVSALEHRLQQGPQNNHGEPVLALTGLRQNGREFPMEMTLSSWQDSTETRYHTAIIRDVSERLQAEHERLELIRSNKDLEEFALIASHDMQEPLRKIAFHIERLGSQENSNGTYGAESLEKVLEATHRMQRLISDLLAYSRVNTLERRRMPVSLNRILNEVISDQERVIREKQAHVDVAPLPEIEADPTQMRQLFDNLLENALKYSQLGVSPQVRIYANLPNGSAIDDTHGSSNQNGDADASNRKPTVTAPRVEIRIEDNGIGFEEKYVDRIFQVFQRLHTRSQYPGTGIGLATCRRIVERHRGHITATSQPNQGATFIVTLPLRQQSVQDPPPNAS